MSFLNPFLTNAINLEAIQQALEDALGVSLLDVAVQIAATIILVIIVKKILLGQNHRVHRKTRRIDATGVYPCTDGSQ